MAAEDQTGARVRERRMALGLRQADLARGAGISASYLNLIEHGRRRAQGTVLARLAQILGTEPETLGETVAGALALELQSAAAGSQGRAELGRVDEFLSRFPGWAGLVTDQHRRIADLDRVVAALNDRIGHDPHLSQALHELLSVVSSVQSTSAILAETEEIAPEWRARFHASLHGDSERLAAGAEALVAYLDGSDQPQDPGQSAPQDEVEAWLAACGWHLDALEPGGPDPAALEAEIAAFASAAARDLARSFVRQAARDAELLPLAAFEAAWAQADGDPGQVATHFAAPVLSVFRRIAFRPGATQGLVICDASGTLILRKPVEGFTIPRLGAVCPLWPLYTALSRPMSSVDTLADLPGLTPTRLRLRAFCEPSFPQGFSGPELRHAAMLIEAAPPGAGPALAIGTSCRICVRGACVARREPSILTPLATAL